MRQSISFTFFFLSHSDQHLDYLLWTDTQTKRIIYTQGEESQEKIRLNNRYFFAIKDEKILFCDSFFSLRFSIEQIIQEHV